MTQKQPLGEYNSSFRAAVSIHITRANSFRTFHHTLDQTSCWFSNSWVDLREHHWFSVQDINQWRKVHLIPSPALQKPSSTELVSLHYKSDRRCPKLCCKYPACCFALIESMHQKPRQKESVVTLHSLPSLHCNTQSWDVWGTYTEEEGDGKNERGGHACKISSLSSQTSHSTASSHIAFSPSRKLLKSKLCFGVQWGFSLWWFIPIMARVSHLFA